MNIMNRNIKFDKVKKIADQAGNTIMYDATIDGKSYSVPIDESNRHYAEIKRQVDAGELTIEDAD